VFGKWLIKDGKIIGHFPLFDQFDIMKQRWLFKTTSAKLSEICDSEIANRDYAHAIHDLHS
jgi:hypothetical protein